MSELVARTKRAAGRTVRAAAARLGYRIVPTGATAALRLPPDYDDFTRSIIERVQPYTLTTHERIAGLVAAVRYLTEAGVPGAFVECGVWRGGSMLTVVETLKSMGDTSRELWLYDTFWLDMPPPGEHDADVFGTSAEELLAEAKTHDAYRNGTADQVRALLVGAGYPEERLHIVEGLVEDTIPAHAPDEIALCRLDTDFYESTAHELAHLVPRVPPGGIVLVDDYGHFVGAKRAVDEFVERIGGGVLLNRLDFSGRLVVMTDELVARVRRVVGTS